MNPFQEKLRQLRQLQNVEDDVTHLKNRVVSNRVWLEHSHMLFHKETVSIGELATNVRKSLGLSQNNVAAKMGIAGPMLSALENGKLPWTDERIAAWSKIILEAKSSIGTQE